MIKPTFFEKFKADNIIMGLTISFSIVGVIAITFIFISPELFVGAAAIFIVAFIEVIIVILRSRYINDIFRNGRVEKAVVTKRFNMGRYSYIAIKYSFDYEEYLKKIRLSPFTIRKFKEDEHIEVIVDEMNPKRVVLKKLYNIN